MKCLILAAVLAVASAGPALQQVQSTYTSYSANSASSGQGASGTGAYGANAGSFGQNAAAAAAGGSLLGATSGQTSFGAGSGQSLLGASGQNIGPIAGQTITTTRQVTYGGASGQNLLGASGHNAVSGQTSFGGASGQNLLGASGQNAASGLGYTSSQTNFGGASGQNLLGATSGQGFISSRKTTFGATSGQSLFGANSGSAAAQHNYGASSFGQGLTDTRAGRKLGLSSDVSSMKYVAANKQGLVPIEVMDFDMPAPGVYQYHYKTADGIEAKQEAQMKADNAEVVQGLYAWVAPDGQKYVVEYTADETGFHPSGAHIPQIPVAIARSLEWNAQHPDEEAQLSQVTVKKTVYA